MTLFSLCRQLKCSVEPEQNNSPDYSCVFGSTKYYGLCGLAGVLSCGLTHTLVVPLDVVKCRVQTNPNKYRGLIKGLSISVKEEGLRALGRGWAPTLIGYSMQGLGKFGLYEVFKNVYAKMLGEENSYVYRTVLYMAASASAEFFADIMLCPMEAVKVRMQTQPGFADTMRKGGWSVTLGLPKIYCEEGLFGFFKGLSPLWARQVPYTIMKFVSFERILEFMYSRIVCKPRDSCSKLDQLTVTFVSGYMAGVLCAVVSHPADVIVSKLNKQKGSSAIEVAKSLGLKGVWAGLMTRILMVGTLTAMQWFIYDAFKVYFRLPRPPPPVMPESLRIKEKVQ
ncbi:Phosphate carrier protein, mitochondrial [Thelohanellus kitauei]|uniref:Phosphate carrier protein, mitochondrial n=1 Tax=Thelohanellus kitauei TaxID=669202 RepID=A0A0C2J5Z5_THEKT|nr:Phosphate carrier protein, mitochondrial [Thelohanellus kitauei]